MLNIRPLSSVQKVEQFISIAILTAEVMTFKN
jgi:hypothetical protein